MVYMVTDLHDGLSRIYFSRSDAQAAVRRIAQRNAGLSPPDPGDEDAISSDVLDYWRQYIHGNENNHIPRGTLRMASSLEEPFLLVGEIYPDSADSAYEEVAEELFDGDRGEFYGKPVMSELEWTTTEDAGPTEDLLDFSDLEVGA